MAHRTPRHDHHNLDHGGPLKGVPAHDHTGPGNGGTLPPIDIGPVESNCCPPDPPFVQVCTDTAGYVQGATSSDAGGTHITFPAAVTIGNTVVYANLGDPGSVGTTDNGWTRLAIETITFTLHLGGPAHIAVWYKVIDAADLEDPVSHLTPGNIVYGLPTWTISTGFQSGAAEFAVDSSTATVTSNTGSSATATSTGAPAGTVGYAFASGVGFPAVSGASVSGWTNAGSTDRGWSGITTSAPTNPSVALGSATEWGIVVVGFTGTTQCTVPKLGQSIWPEIGEGSGLADSQQTNYDYRAGAIHVYLSGVHVAPVETDPANGIWEWPTDVIPEAGETWVVYYRTEFGHATGAGNDLADPTSLVLRPSNVVNGSGPLTVGSSVTAWARGDHGPHLDADAIDDLVGSGATSWWRLLTVYDGTNWLPLVDGDGAALYTFA